MINKEELRNYLEKNPFIVEVNNREEDLFVLSYLGFLDTSISPQLSYPSVYATFYVRSPLCCGRGGLDEYPATQYNFGKRYTFKQFVEAFEGILFPKRGKGVRKIMKDIVEVKFKHDGERQLLSIELLDKELAKLFQSEDTETSEKYTDADGDGLEFHTLTDKLSRFSRKFNETNSAGRPITLRKYGSTLVSEEDGGSKFNLSILRSVDILDGVTVDLDGLILTDDISSWSESLANFLKYAYKEFVVEKNREVRATVTIEY